MLKFTRYIAIDYSGAQTASSSLSGLRIYMAQNDSSCEEVLPPPSPRKYWTRKEVAEWLVERLSEDVPTLVGIDHGFSFPLEYFKRYGITCWDEFLEDFQNHWPTDDENMYVCFVRDGHYGNGATRSGDPRWKRIAEERTRTAKSVFRFEGQGTVAYSTHAGLPWLLYIRKKLPGRVHFWPFDGWDVPENKSALVEIYPALWNKAYPREDRNEHQHDAFSAASWMRDTDRNGKLEKYFHPEMTESERKAAMLEGWILGVG